MTCSRPSPRSGLTLLEVLAASVLLAVLLGAVVRGTSEHTRQFRRAEEQLAAQQYADRLLSRWLVEQQGAIEATEGFVEDRRTWRWRVSGRVEPGLEPFGLHIGALEILAATPGAAETRLAYVEFVSSAATTASQILEAPR